MGGGQTNPPCQRREGGNKDHRKILISRRRDEANLPGLFRGKGGQKKESHVPSPKWGSRALGMVESRSERGEGGLSPGKDCPSGGGKGDGYMEGRKVPFTRLFTYRGGIGGSQAEGGGKYRGFPSRNKAGHRA